MSYSLFKEWEAYDELEPFGEARADARTAAIERALFNIFKWQTGSKLAKKYPDGFPLGMFLVQFGDRPPFTGHATTAKTVEEIPQWQRNKAALLAIAHAWALNPGEKQGS